MDFPLIAIALGGAANAWDELAMARELAPAADIIACNHAGRDLDGPFAHWATMHPELMAHWWPERAAAGKPMPRRLWFAQHRAVPANFREPYETLPSPGGSSGLLCVSIALHLGYARVIIAGIPMVQTFRHYDDGRRWQEARQYLPAWERHLPQMRGRVKSWSGETGKMLGPPSREWIDGAEQERKGPVSLNIGRRGR